MVNQQIQANILILSVLFISAQIVYCAQITPPHSHNVPHIAYWLSSSSYTWLHAFHHIFLLSPQWSDRVLGEEDYNPEHAAFIKAILKKNIRFAWDTIRIKTLKPQLHLKIQKPLICTNNTIFVNPEFYNPLSDFRSEYEREALILQVGLIISTASIKKSALFFTLLPLASHLGLKTLANLTDKKHFWANICSSYITRFCINYYATKSYLAWQKAWLHRRLCRLLLNSFTYAQCLIQATNQQ